MIWTRLRFSLFRLGQAVKIVRRYYRCAPYRWADLKLQACYFAESPYRVSANYWRARRSCDPYTYGETPLTTLEEIAKQFLAPSDHLIDLGSGTGRGALWLRHFLGCRVTGIECIPIFAHRARKLVQGATFHEGDLLEIDLSDATAVYLAGTCLSDAYLSKLALHLEGLPRGARVISVTFPIDEYARPGQFAVKKKVALPFPWGSDLVYCSERL